MGDPTEGALVVLAAKGGVDPVLTRERYPRIAEAPLRRRVQAHGHVPPHEGRCGQGRHPLLREGRAGPAAGAAPDAHGPTARRPRRPVRDAYLAENERLGDQGLRVMATASATSTRRPSTRAPDLLPLVSDLTLLSLVGIVDPPRPEAKDAIAEAQRPASGSG